MAGGYVELRCVGVGSGVGHCNLIVVEHIRLDMTDDVKRTVPFLLCFKFEWNSSWKKCACAPHNCPYIESPPLPVPVGSPVWIIKFSCTLKNNTLL